MRSMLRGEFARVRVRGASAKVASQSVFPIKGAGSLAQRRP